MFHKRFLNCVAKTKDIRNIQEGIYQELGIRNC